MNFQLEYILFLGLMSYVLIFDLPTNGIGLLEAIAVIFYAFMSIIVVLEVRLEPDIFIHLETIVVFLITLALHQRLAF